MKAGAVFCVVGHRHIGTDRHSPSVPRGNQRSAASGGYSELISRKCPGFHDQREAKTG